VKEDSAGVEMEGVGVGGGGRGGGGGGGKKRKKKGGGGKISKKKKKKKKKKNWVGAGERIKSTCQLPWDRKENPISAPSIHPSIRWVVVHYALNKVPCQLHYIVSNPRRRTISFNGQNIIPYKPLPGPLPHRINSDLPGSA